MGTIATRRTSARSPESLAKKTLTEIEAYNISRLCPANKGDILEGIMGYAWIYNKTQMEFLKDFPEYVNILEKGLQSATEDSDQQEKEEEDIKEKHDQKIDEIMKNHAGQLMKEIQPSLDKIYQRLENIENNVTVQKEMTKIGLKKIEDVIYGET
eukprot:15998829-Heterocapsa_arctica.AAC.1